jgi:hypothetical protein
LEAFLIILAVVIGVLSIVYAGWWVCHHRCAICGNIHMDESELEKCKICQRLFCRDKSTQREILRSNVRSVLGEGLHLRKENKIDYRGKQSCGYIYIESSSARRVSSRYCHIHDPRRARKGTFN